MTKDAFANTDAQLLASFSELRDQAAFTELVRRHGPMVQAAAMRVLANEDDASDAMQATFMALSRHAGRLWRDEGVGGWLYVTAKRCALRIRQLRARELKLQCSSARSEGVESVSVLESAEAVALLEEEIAKLPSELRTVIVLCDLESMSKSEAAKRLGVSATSIRKRSAKAYLLLSSRLTRRGITYSVGGIGGLLSGLCEGHAIAPAVVAQTVEVSAAYAVGMSADVLNTSNIVAKIANGVEPLMKTTTYAKYAALALAMTVLFQPTITLLGLTEKATMAGMLLFRDDFDDFNEADDAPATWVPEPLAPSVAALDAGLGDLVVSTNGDLAGARLEGVLLEDVSVQTRLRRGTDDYTIAITLRQGSTDPDGYQAGFGFGGGIFLTRVLDGKVLNVQSNLNPTVEDVILQFDAIGDRLEVRAWRPEETMPQSPQLSALVSDLSSSAPLERGLVSLVVGRLNSSGPKEGIFRYVEVSKILPGDFDGDFDVDGNDYLRWQRDPTVGEFTAWRASYGSSVPAVGSVNVPEPATIALTAIVLCIPIRQRRFRIVKHTGCTHCVIPS